MNGASAGVTGSPGPAPVGMPGLPVDAGAVQLPEVSLIGLPCTALALAAATVPGIAAS
jgi:hypothetical protein